MAWRVVWTEIFAEGGKPFEGLLRRPPARMNFYRDIAVLAVPTLAGDEIKMSGASPKITSSGMPSQTGGFALVGPKGNAPQFIQIELDRPFPGRMLSMTIEGFSSPRTNILISDDGVTFQPIKGSVETKSFAAREGSSKVWRFEPPVQARFYRVEFPKMNQPGTSQFHVRDLEISPCYGYGVSSASARAKWPELPAAFIIPRDRILDLSSRMDASGLIQCLLPPGRWTLLRLGCTTTGQLNHTAPESGRGLECDKFSKQAVGEAFKAFMGRLIADNQGLIGKGKVSVSTHIESWEVGTQNWAPRMRSEFQRLRG